MGMGRQADIEGWQLEHGIRPAQGEQANLLEQISRAAFELIKDNESAEAAFELICTVELERSGIRDGDGYWSGSDPIMGIRGQFPESSKVAKLIAALRGAETEDPTKVVDDAAHIAFLDHLDRLRSGDTNDELPW